MRVALPLFLLLSGMSTACMAESTPEEQVKAFSQCRSEPSPLIRLECYDKAWGTVEQATPPQEVAKNRGKNWLRATEQEKQRTEHSTGFLVKTSGTENNPTVILTTPALGRQPPRPVLMLSCIDNITRMQIALPSQIKESDIAVTLQTEKTEFKSDWFLRESGYLLESSRGLPGIAEIQRLFGAETLTIKSDLSALNGLTFNISQLSQEIKPLRTACHW